MQMQIKSLNMAQWPPSPSVEDEDTALSREHSIDALLASKSDDQPAVDRGAIDQYPVIIDSPDLSKPILTDQGNQPSLNPLPTDVCSSDDSTGPPTPSPVLRDVAESDGAPTKSPSDPPLPSPSMDPLVTLQQQTSNRGRPHVTRIQTDMGGDVQSMATGTRRKPSPYSYTRPPTFDDSSASCLTHADNLLSPKYAQQKQQQPRAHVVGRRSFDRSAVPGVEDNVQPRNQYRDDTYYKQSTPTVRSSPQMHYNCPQPQPQPQSATTPRIRRSFTEFSGRSDFQETERDLLTNRRLSKESPFISSGDERPVWNRSASKRSTAAVRDSPYTSSAEESPRQHERRSGHGSGSEQKRSRRRSSHRKERPSLQAYEVRPRSDAAPPSESRYYRQEPSMRPQQHPITPVSGEFSRTEIEDYFANAFKANELRRSQNAYTPRSSGSALNSPLTSPPRTPRSERQGREYFDLTPTGSRPAQYSRPPSIDESQIRDPRAYGSLLSAATVGAAVAARVIDSTSKSRSTSTDTSKQTNAPRSGRPSPVQEESRASPKTAVHNLTGSLAVDRGSLMPGYSGRPVSRGTLNGDETLSVSGKFHPHAHRSLSYSIADHVQPWNVSYPASAVSPTLGTNVAPAPGYPSVRPQSRSARSSVNTIDVPVSATSTFGLPTCPRPHPVAGYCDWYTIKEMSNLDLCPTCANVIANSRYRNLLVPSLPRPYNEPSMCAMSKPWVRVAFLQSRRQDRPDLRYIRDVMAPSKRPPCTGGKKDINRWFCVVDPKTREPVPGFGACAACVDLVDQIFTDVGSIFYRPAKWLNEERSCGLHAESKHFQSIIDQLEQLSERCGRRWRSADTEDLVRHLRRIARYQPCSQDELQTSRAWHLMSELPEFSVCDDCYDEVVKPIQDWPIARDITRSLKSVPTARGTGSEQPTSCQLYSDRMRKVFREAVETRNFALLREAVKARVSTQHRLDAMNKLYEQDLRYGIDRRHELEKNLAIWKAIE